MSSEEVYTFDESVDYQSSDEDSTDLSNKQKQKIHELKAKIFFTKGR